MRDSQDDSLVPGAQQTGTVPVLGKDAKDAEKARKHREKMAKQAAALALQQQTGEAQHEKLDRRGTPDIPTIQDKKMGIPV